MDERLKHLADSQEEDAVSDLASECGNYRPNWSARLGSDGWHSGLDIIYPVGGAGLTAGGITLLRR